MSRTFNDSLEADIEDVFLNTNEFARTVTYQRGPNTVELAAMTNLVAYSASGQDGREITEHFWVYVVKASALVIDGNRIDPRNGDRIRDTFDGVSRIFEVVKRKDRPAGELLSCGYRWQVHTQEVKQ